MTDKDISLIREAATVVDSSWLGIEGDNSLCDELRALADRMEVAEKQEPVAEVYLNAEQGYPYWDIKPLINWDDFPPEAKLYLKPFVHVANTDLIHCGYLLYWPSGAEFTENIKGYPFSVPSKKVYLANTEPTPAPVSVEQAGLASVEPVTKESFADRMASLSHKSAISHLQKSIVVDDIIDLDTAKRYLKVALLAVAQSTTTSAPTEFDNVFRDAVKFGTGLTLDGKHIPFEQLYEQPEQAGEVEPLDSEINKLLRFNFDSTDGAFKRVTDTLLTIFAARKQADKLLLKERADLIDELDIQLSANEKEIKGQQARIAELEAENNQLKVKHAVACDTISRMKEDREMRHQNCVPSNQYVESTAEAANEFNEHHETMLTRIAELEAQRDEYKKDAERYRLIQKELTPKQVDSLFEWVNDECNPPYRTLKIGAGLDSALDAIAKD